MWKYGDDRFFFIWALIWLLRGEPGRRADFTWEKNSEFTIDQYPTMVAQTFIGIFESLSHMRPNSGLDILFGPKIDFLDKFKNYKFM